MCVCVCVRERERERKRERAIARKYQEMNDAPKMLRCEACQQVVWLPLGSLTQGSATAATGARNTHTNTHTHTANSRTQHTHTHSNRCNRCSRCERARIHPRSCCHFCRLVYTTKCTHFFSFMRMCILTTPVSSATQAPASAQYRNKKI